MSAADELVFPAEFRVEALADPVVEAVGFPVHHAYVELLWLPVIGPSTAWLLRRLSWWAEARPDGVTVQLAELAGWLGIGSSLGGSSTVQRSLRRLVRFGLAAWQGERLTVRTVVPPLSERHLRRLSPSLRGTRMTGWWPAAGRPEHAAASIRSGLVEAAPAGRCHRAVGAVGAEARLVVRCHEP